MTIDNKAKRHSLKTPHKYYRDRIIAIQLKILPFSY